MRRHGSARASRPIRRAGPQARCGPRHRASPAFRSAQPALRGRETQSRSPVPVLRVKHNHQIRHRRLARPARIARSSTGRPASIAPLLRYVAAGPACPGPPRRRRGEVDCAHCDCPFDSGPSLPRWSAGLRLCRPKLAYAAHLRPDNGAICRICAAGCPVTGMPILPSCRAARLITLRRRAKTVRHSHKDWAVAHSLGRPGLEPAVFSGADGRDHRPAVPPAGRRASVPDWSCQRDGGERARCITRPPVSARGRADARAGRSATCPPRCSLPGASRG